MQLASFSPAQACTPDGPADALPAESRAGLIARAALRILLPLRGTRRDLPGARGAIRQHISSLHAYRSDLATGSNAVAASPAEPALREFVVLIHSPGEPTQERTVWALRSVDVAMDAMDEALRDGSARSRIQVKALGAPQQCPQ